MECERMVAGEERAVEAKVLDDLSVLAGRRW